MSINRRAFAAFALAQSALCVSNAVAADYKVPGYFTQLGICGRNLQPTDIPVDKITHFNHPVINISADGTAYVGTGWNPVATPALWQATNSTSCQ